MSRKQDENTMLARRHKAAVEAKKNRDPAAKRCRQRDTEAFKHANTDAERAKMKPEEKYRADTSRGRRLISRAEAHAKVVTP